ncbi:conserved hypothetical protein [Planktothrix rubescens CCAP 1459/22]|uniref:Uncharacterized protein n=1 Tax=Planktothrix rubescens CCAP 1459/22 TaxID=329571 RepID=A0A6J7ZNH0_PLARU|nr:conserved hypothetical protein [Planktothrix rubescens NIVA-CYA 18]
MTNGSLNGGVCPGVGVALGFGEATADGEVAGEVVGLGVVAVSSGLEPHPPNPTAKIPMENRNQN